MKKTLLALLILLVFGGGHYLYQRLVYAELPRRIGQLDKAISHENEKLIAAQIIARQLQQVTRLIEGNLALSLKDSLAEDASMPFMNYVTDLLQKMNVRLVKIEPGQRVNMADYIKTPYSLEVETSYANMVSFLNQLEKSDRLVTVEEFDLSNSVKRSEESVKRGTMDQRPMTITISTLTLLKHR
jgi:Tfp pilus assembly protein PilO